MKINLIALVLIAFASGAQACSSSQNLPGENIDVMFSRDGSTISGSETLKLANWAVDINSKYEIQDFVHIRGLAEASENQSQQLSAKRAEAVRQMLAQFGLKKAPFEVVSRIYHPLKPSDAGENGKRVEITLSPGCPNHCCDGQ